MDVKTNFFTQLEKYGIDNYALSIIFKNGSCTVSLLPKSNANDKATKFKPLTLSANTDEMDLEFFNTINQNLKTTADFYSNVESYERKLKIQQDETAEKKELKEKIKKLENKLTAIFNNEKFDANNDKSKVLLLCKELLILDKNNKKAITSHETIINLTNALF